MKLARYRHRGTIGVGRLDPDGARLWPLAAASMVEAITRAASGEALADAGAAVALTDVTIEPLFGPRRTERRDFVALSLRHIVLVMPSEDGAGEAAAPGAAEA